MSMKFTEEKLELAVIDPEELTIDQLFQTHESFPRNPLIADICYNAGYIDSWGHGVEKIIESCNEYQLPVPNIFERSGGIVMELRKSPEKSPEKGLGNELGKGLGNELGNLKDQILCEMKNNPIVSGVQLAKILSISTTAVEKSIKQLRKEGRIKRIGGTRGHWIVIDD